jgi:hypothetical protein
MPAQAFWHVAGFAQIRASSATFHAFRKESKPFAQFNDVNKSVDANCSGPTAAAFRDKPFRGILPDGIETRFGFWLVEFRPGRIDPFW